MGATPGTLGTRILTSAEANMFMASLANRMAMAQDAMATASDDRDMVMLRRVIAEFDLCQALHKLVAGGHIRVMELKP